MAWPSSSSCSSSGSSNLLETACSSSSNYSSACVSFQPPPEVPVDSSSLASRPSLPTLTTTSTTQGSLQQQRTGSFTGFLFTRASIAAASTHLRWSGRRASIEFNGCMPVQRNNIDFKTREKDVAARLIRTDCIECTDASILIQLLLQMRLLRR